MLSRTTNIFKKVASLHSNLKNRSANFNLSLKQLLFRESIPVTAKYVENWKNYYEILQVSSSAEPKTIAAAYKRLAHIFNHSLSSRAKESEFFSEMISDINEAYQVLSVPINRTAYDCVFWLKYNAESTGIDETDKISLIDLSQSIAQDVSSAKRRIIWRVPVLNKVTRRVVTGVAIFLFAVLVGGTTLAFVNPEHALASPFREVAITLTKTASGAIGLIEDIRGVAASSERKVVSTALQSMRVDKGLKWVPEVTVSTNDMASFPSQGYSLFPDYLENRLSQYKYTVDSKGVVSIDTAGATTDAFIGNIKQILERLEYRE